MVTLGAALAAVVSAFGAAVGLWMMGSGVAAALTERRTDALAHLAASLGLRLVRDGVVEGAVDDVPVTVVGRASGFSLTARVGPGAHRLRIGSRRVFAAPDEPLGEIGFDDRIHVTGEPPEVRRARMDRETRQVVFRAVIAGAALRGGAWRMDLATTDGDLLARRTLLLVEAVRAIDATTGPVEERLEAIAADDPRMDLRYRALTARIAMGPVDTGWLQERVRANLSPPGALGPGRGDWRVVVVAAQLLGADGHADLVRILDADDKEARRAAAIALAAVGPGGVQDRVETELLGALDRPHKALLEALARVGTVRAIPALRGAAGRCADRRRTHRRILEVIAAIQARAGGPPGALSLAEVPPKAGGLSLAEVQAVGRLGPVGGLPRLGPDDTTIPPTR